MHISKTRLYLIYHIVFQLKEDGSVLEINMFYETSYVYFLCMIVILDLQFFSEII